MRTVDDVHEKKLKKLNSILCGRLHECISDFLSVDMKDFDHPSRLAVVFNSFINLTMFAINNTSDNEITRRILKKRVIEGFDEMEKKEKEKGRKGKPND